MELKNVSKLVISDPTQWNSYSLDVSAIMAASANWAAYGGTTGLYT
jgi:hypothetical protein